jgi:hypothetical protein
MSRDRSRHTDTAVAIRVDETEFGCDRFGAVVIAAAGAP